MTSSFLERLRYTSILSMILLCPALASAHGFAGKRFFPATLTFDDPFPQDEFGLLFNSMPDARNEDGDTVDLHSLDIEYAKTITPGFALSIGTAHIRAKNPDGSTVHGFDNMELGAKVLGHVNEETESVWSYGLDIDVGDTSSHGIGESYSTYSPTFYFGKGFGNTFDAASSLRPLALSGSISVAVPEQNGQPRNLVSAFAVQYSLTYLETNVEDIGLPKLLRNSVLIIETPLSTCLDHGCNGEVTGTVNPGIIFFNHWGQLSVEAQIPVSDRTGDSVGALVQLHFNLDDVFPNTLGKPIFN